MEPDQRLPGGESAVVPPEKVEAYLLNAFHVQNKGKAQFYELAGYSLTQPERLENDLVTIARTGRVIATETTSRGTLYEVRGKIVAPNQREYSITTVWFIQINQSIPALVTAYPNKK